MEKIIEGILGLLSEELDDELPVLYETLNDAKILSAEYEVEPCNHEDIIAEQKAKIEKYEEKLNKIEEENKKNIAVDIVEMRKKKGYIDDDQYDDKIEKLSVLPKEALEEMLQDTKELTNVVHEGQPKVNDTEGEGLSHEDKKKLVREKLFGKLEEEVE